MPETDLAKLAERTADAPEPIKRTVERTAKPNPMQPILAAAWETRSKRNGSETEVGATKQIRTYSPAETTSLVRALRRASDALNVGVEIDAPEEEYEKDGKTKKRYKAGNVKFQPVTRQKRTRKQGSEQESAATAGQESDEQESGEESKDVGTDAEEEEASPEQQTEPAWQ
jgi:hypothetical protein